MDYVTEVYPKVDSVSATKRPDHQHCDADCRRNGHRYIHEFASPAPRLLGLPDGSLLVLPDGQTFRLSDGSMLITD